MLAKVGDYVRTILKNLPLTPDLGPLGFDPSVEGIVVAVNPSTIEVKTIAGDIFTCMNFPEIMIFPNEALTDVQLDFAHDERENLASQDYRG